MVGIVKAMISQIFGSGLIDDLTKTLKITTGDGNSTLTMLKGLYSSVFVPVGVCILMMFFCYAIMDRAMAEGFTFETGAKMMLKLVLLAVFLTSAFDIVTYFIELGNNVLADMNVTIAQADDVTNTICHNLGLDSYGDGILDQILAFLETLPLLLLFLIPWLVSIVCNLLVQIIALTRELELYARACFLPIALGDSFNGLSSGAVRYLKSFLAVCLQGALIVVICYVSGSMFANYLKSDAFKSIMATGDLAYDLDNAWQLVVMPVVYKVAQAGLVAKSMPLAKEICGC